jgi:hypothetical protein
VLARAFVGNAEMGGQLCNGGTAAVLDVKQDLAAGFGQSLNCSVHGFIPPGTQ